MTEFTANAVAWAIKAEAAELSDFLATLNVVASARGIKVSTGNGTVKAVKSKTPSVPADPNAPKRGRGRPKGSKNKPAGDVVGTIAPAPETVAATAEGADAQFATGSPTA